MKKTVRLAFTIFLIIFMLGGTLLVLGQLVGMILMNGQLMLQASQLFGTPTFVCAAIAGFLGFIYSYFPKEKKQAE